MDKQWTSRSSIAIFISALHLLDLDTLKDWPSITISTFQGKATSQSLQAKIKATEWALYQLFQSYSPESARILSPNFPPKTPIQSLNLRAGIFKLLTELKKNALLPREIMLRKTMLDECKGDKFEDLLAAFSMLVLRKVVSDGKETIPTTRKPPKPEHVVPLIIAHHVSLQNQLRQRERLRGDACSHAKSLDMRRTDYAARLQCLSRAGDDDGGEVSQNENNTLRERVVCAFAADPRWARFLFEGNIRDISLVPLLNHDMVSRWPSEDPTAAMSEIEQNSLQASQPMSQLKTLISQYKTRTQHLQILQASLLSVEASSAAVIPIERPRLDYVRHPPTKATSEPRFNRHKVLNLTSMPV